MRYPKIPVPQILNGCVFGLTGTFTSCSQVEMKKKIKSLGGDVTLNCCGSDVTHIVSTQANFDDLTKPVKNAIRHNLPIVKEEFIEECDNTQSKVDAAPYTFAVSDEIKEKIKEEFKEEDNKEKKKPGRPRVLNKPAKPVKAPSDRKRGRPAAGSSSTTTTNTTASTKVAKTVVKSTEPTFKTKRVSGPKVDLKLVEKSLGIQKKPTASSSKVRASRSSSPPQEE